MRFFGHAIALLLVAAGTAWGAGVPKWRDWSKPVQFVGGNPFEQVVAVDEELRLQRRAEPILGQIGENTLTLRLAQSMHGGVRAPAAMFHDITSTTQDAEETPSKKKGKDIEQLMRDLGLGSSGTNGKKGSIASLALGDEDDEEKASKWGWLADEVRGDNSRTQENAESAEEAAEANGRLLDDVTDFLDTETDSVRWPTANGSDKSTTTTARSEGEGAGRLDSGIAQPPAMPELRGTQDLMTRLAGNAETAASASGGTAPAATATPSGDDNAPKSFAPDWDSLLAGGKTVDWREAAGMGKGPASYASAPTEPAAKDKPTADWSRPPSSGSAISSPSSLRPESGLGSTRAETSLWDRATDSGSTASWTGFGNGGGASDFGSGGWSASSSSSLFGGDGFGNRDTGMSEYGFGGRSASVPSTPTFGGSTYSGGYRVPDAGAAGVKLRDTMNSTAGGGMKPAWF